MQVNSIPGTRSRRVQGQHHIRQTWVERGVSAAVMAQEGMVVRQGPGRQLVVLNQRLPVKGSLAAPHVVRQQARRARGSESVVDYTGNQPSSAARLVRRFSSAPCQFPAVPSELLESEVEGSHIAMRRKGSSVVEIG